MNLLLLIEIIGRKLWTNLTEVIIRGSQINPHQAPNTGKFGVWQTKKLGVRFVLFLYSSWLELQQKSVSKGDEQLIKQAEYKLKYKVFHLQQSTPFSFSFLNDTAQIYSKLFGLRSLRTPFWEPLLWSIESKLTSNVQQVTCEILKEICSRPTRFQCHVQSVITEDIRIRLYVYFYFREILVNSFWTAVELYDI